MKNFTKKKKNIFFNKNHSNFERKIYTCAGQDVIQSGVENLDSGIGVYAPDAEAYVVFALLFNPIIEEYHGGFSADMKNPMSDFGDPSSFEDLDPERK